MGLHYEAAACNVPRFVFKVMSVKQPDITAKSAEWLQTGLPEFT